MPLSVEAILLPVLLPFPTPVKGHNEMTTAVVNRGHREISFGYLVKILFPIMPDIDVTAIIFVSSGPVEQFCLIVLSRSPSP